MGEILRHYTTFSLFFPQDIHCDLWEFLRVNPHRHGDWHHGRNRDWPAVHVHRVRWGGPWGAIRLHGAAGSRWLPECQECNCLRQFAHFTWWVQLPFVLAQVDPMSSSPYAMPYPEIKPNIENYLASPWFLSVFAHTWPNHFGSFQVSSVGTAVNSVVRLKLFCMGLGCAFGDQPMTQSCVVAGETAQERQSQETAIKQDVIMNKTNDC